MGEEKRIGKILSTFVVLLGSIFFLVSVFGILFNSSILRILDTPDHVFGTAREYLRMMFLGIPFLAIYNTYAAVLRGLGDSRAPFLSVLVCSLINAVLDILFVAVLRLGVTGVAAATVVAQKHWGGRSKTSEKSIENRKYHDCCRIARSDRGGSFGRGESYCYVWSDTGVRGNWKEFF